MTSLIILGLKMVMQVAVLVLMIAPLEVWNVHYLLIALQFTLYHSKT